MQGLLKYRVCSIYFIMSLFLDTIEVPFIFVHKGVVFWNVQKKQKCGILTSEIIFDSTNKKESPFFITRTPEKIWPHIMKLYGASCAVVIQSSSPKSKCALTLSTLDSSLKAWTLLSAVAIWWITAMDRTASILESRKGRDKLSQNITSCSFYRVEGHLNPGLFNPKL